MIQNPYDRTTREGGASRPAHSLHCSSSTDSYPLLTGVQQQRYYFDHFHAAVLRCARRFGWDEEHFDAARKRMLADGLRFAFRWKKPLASPNRRMKVQGFVEAGPRTCVSLVFTDRHGNQLRHCRLAVIPTMSCDLRYIFGRIEWINDHAVRVIQSNGRDYWICTADGEVEFHYPRAERGDPHGEYDLGRMYYDGALTHLGRDRGLALMRSAAAKGYKHAAVFLDRLNGKPDAECGD